MMESQPHRAFPLSLYFHYDNFRHYYAFGNSPAEDFLQSVSPRECHRPTILSLGCGDMRFVMFTIFKNFSIEGENSDGFKGVNFILNDRSAAVLARNILFLYLCMNMPDDEVEQKEWIASVWSLWYNHELLPQHDRMLSRALQQLIQWSVTWQEWSNCPLGVVVQFSSPGTFAKIKKRWSWWNSHLIKSVDKIKKARSDFQFHHMETTRGYFKSREATLKKRSHEDFNNVMLTSVRLLYSHETISRMENEYLHYLTEGTVWAEYILDLPISNPKTVVNPTLFEREDGMYSLQYSLTPYMGFNQSFQYTHTEVGKTLGKSSPLLKQLPVADTHFKSVPLLANSVQQFAMWLKATSHLMKKSSGGKLKVSTLFDLDDSLNLCCSMIHHPEMYTKFGVQFDAIYTSNLFDHIHPPALVFSALPLLKPTGILFTCTFKAPIRGNLENIFGFSPELFPVFLGIHCVGHDGDYSSAVNPTPYPIANHLQSHRILFPWRHIESQPLIFEESPDATKSLLQLCRINCNLGPLFGGSVDSFLCVFWQFMKQFESLPSPSHPFLKSLFYAIQSTPELKPHLVQLQTQALLHGMHLHITLTESDCPICRGQPLESYIQQFTVSVDIGGKTGVYESPSFTIHLVKKSGELATVTSIAVDISGSKLELVFFLPKHCLSQYDIVRVDMFPALNDETECIFIDTMDCLRSSSIEFLFFREPVKQHHTEIHALGDIVKHIGNGCSFETIISMNETCQAREVSKLNAICSESECNQLKLSYGGLESNIVYPYAIDESKVQLSHVKVSKKRGTISVTVQRDGTVFFKEKPTYFIDPSNKLILPRFHCGTDVIEKYCDSQLLVLNVQDHPLFNAKRSFVELFKHALSGQKYFTLSFPSKRFKDAPDAYALVFVHDLRFYPAFASPALDVSYCFLDTKSPHLIHELSVMQNSLGRTRNIMVDDAEYKYLKGVFTFFSTLTQCALSTEKHTVALPVQKHKLWRHFDQAIMFPLYPNPANPTYQKFDRFVTACKTFPGNMSPSHDHLAKLGEGNVNACSFCSQSSESVTLKNCGRCHKAKYCSEECQRMHWKFHKLVCSASEQQKKAAAEEEPNSPQPHPSLDSSRMASDSTPKHSLGGIGDHVSESEGFAETAKVTNTCMRCKKPTTINCSCKSVSNCSKACQTLEWPQHSEKCKGQVDKNKPNSAVFASEDTNKAASHAGNSCSTKCSRCNNPATIICSCGSVSYCSNTCQTLELPQHSKKCKQPSSDNNSSKRCKDPAAGRKVSADDDDSKREPTTFPTLKCSNCSKTKSSLKRCKCCNVSYCSVECQRLHWPQHKSTCTAVKK